MNRFFHALTVIYLLSSGQKAAIKLVAPNVDTLLKQRSSGSDYENNKEDGQMFQERKDSQALRVAPGEFAQPDLCYDPEKIVLEGHYGDEISAQRAKRCWEETFETYFLLEPEEDFEITVKRDLENTKFSITCCFYSACARYAFWRLTNEQAPEAQYRIETAHVPNAESRYSDFVSAPDLQSVSDGPLLLQGWAKPPKLNQDWIERFKEMLSQFRNIKK